SHFDRQGRRHAGRHRRGGKRGGLQEQRGSASDLRRPLEERWGEGCCRRGRRRAYGDCDHVGVGKRGRHCEAHGFGRLEGGGRQVEEEIIHDRSVRSCALIGIRTSNPIGGRLAAAFFAEAANERNGRRSSSAAATSTRASRSSRRGRGL